MSLDPDQISACIAAHGPVARLVVAASKGSAPREAGAAMLVWARGQSGTIGGGALEFEAVARARRNLSQGKDQDHWHMPLGPALGQCCGGAVSLLCEVLSHQSLHDITETRAAGLPWCRPVSAGLQAEPPLSIKRILNAARATGQRPDPGLVDGWMVEPFTAPRRPLWLYGAGHVGRAIVTAFRPLPYDITWIDTDRTRFPDVIPDNADPLVAADPAQVVTYAPPAARHLILTYSHKLDLDLCHAVLSRDFAAAGLIGSATKWSRFRKRLGALGHGDAQIDRITCPIGLPELGKAPENIAAGVVTKVLMEDVAPMIAHRLEREHA
jgi:xanthine dehydrogenase accessory factor